MPHAGRLKVRPTSWTKHAAPRDDIPMASALNHKAQGTHDTALPTFLAQLLTARRGLQPCSRLAAFAQRTTQRGARTARLPVSADSHPGEGEGVLRVLRRLPPRRASTSAKRAAKPARWSGAQHTLTVMFCLARRNAGRKAWSNRQAVLSTCCSAHAGLPRAGCRLPVGGEARGKGTGWPAGLPPKPGLSARPAPWARLAMARQLARQRRIGRIAGDRRRTARAVFICLSCSAAPRGAI